MMTEGSDDAEESVMDNDLKSCSLINLMRGISASTNESP